MNRVKTIIGFAALTTALACAQDESTQAEPGPLTSCEGFDDLVGESLANKLAPGLDFSSDLARPYLITFKNVPLPECELEQECESRLRTRSEEHKSRIDCVLRTSGPSQDRAWWYEKPMLANTPDPIANMLATTVPLLGRDVLTVASHPFVSRVSVPPRLSPDTQCDDEWMPPSEDESQVIWDSDTEKGGSTYFAVVGVHRPFACDDCTTLATQRMTHFLSTNLLSCLYQYIDDTVGDFRLLEHATGFGSFTERMTTWQSEFAVGLTESEAELISRHPYVSFVRMTNATIPPVETRDSALAADTNEGQCPESTELIDGKIADQEWLLSLGGNISVRIYVRGGAGPGQLRNVTCPAGGRSCPERDALLASIQDANLTSQRCVRERIEQLGGTAQAPLAVQNAFYASLNAEQIREIAAHPHLKSIESSEGRIASTPP